MQDEVMCNVKIAYFRHDAGKESVGKAHERVIIEPQLPQDMVN